MQSDEFVITKSDEETMADCLRLNSHMDLPFILANLNSFLSSFDPIMYNLIVGF